MTERRLHRKKEIEARRNETWTQINNYFNSCSARCKRFNDWSRMKPAARVFSLPPFDGDFSDSIPEVDAERLEETELKLKNVVKELTDIEEEAESLKVTGTEIIAQISFLEQTMSHADGEISSWIIKSRRILFVRFTRDKLRHQLFLSFEKLSYFHTLISTIFPVEICNKILTREEGDELKAIILGGQSIIQVFIDLNRQRNHEIVNMFQ